MKALFCIAAEQGFLILLQLTIGCELLNVCKRVRPLSGNNLVSLLMIKKIAQ